MIDSGGYNRVCYAVVDYVAIVVGIPWIAITLQGAKNAKIPQATS
jgi:hypothetical protein